MARYFNFAVLSSLIVLTLSSPALAETGGTGDSGLIPIGIGLAMGLAALGGTLGQSKAVSSGLDAIGRNPSASGKIFTPFILGLVFIESLVVFTFVVAQALLGKF